MSETTLTTDLPALRKQLADKVDFLKSHAAAFKIEDNGGVVVDAEVRDSYRKALKDAQELRGLIEDHEGYAALKGWVDAPAGTGGNGSIATRAAAGQAGRRGAKTLGEMFTESAEFKALLKTGGGNMSAPFVVEGADLGSYFVGLGGGRKDIYTSLPTGDPTAPRFGPIQFDPMVPLPQRKVRVRDLFPVQPTTAGLIEFYKVTGFTNNASTVPERAAGAFALKPQSGFTFALDQAPVRTIAHWEVAHRNVLADEPQLQGLVNNELLYGLRLQEDFQILAGTGNGEDLLGVLNTPGIQHHTQASVGADTPIDAVRRSVTLVLLALFEPTGVVLNPLDWEAMELTKNTLGNYILSQNVAIGADQRLWRLPVVDTPAMAQKTVLVGAFGLGAQLYDREQGNIRTAEQHSDFFLRNALVILAEERLALATKRPESFVDLTLT